VRADTAKPRGWLKRFTTVELVFIATMIAADFGFGLVIKPLLDASHIADFVRIDLIVPTMLMLLTRLVVDKFGTLTLYEFVIGMLAMLAWPQSYGVPGPLKLPFFAAKGLVWDLCMSALRPWLGLRLFVTAILGEGASATAAMGIKLLLGLPWVPLTQLLLGARLVTTLIVGSMGAALGLAVWKAIRDTAMVQRIAAWRHG
jgi:hypothetical protein